MREIVLQASFSERGESGQAMGPGLARLLKTLGVLRHAQHERKMLNQFKHRAVRPEALEE
jgi:hypothetical protein